MSSRYLVDKRGVVIVYNILEVSGLTKDYGKFKLSDVTFNLPQDCITGFIGVNGSGKTTTIKSILGLIKKEAGHIKFRGKDISQDEIEFKNKIGFVFDSDCFFDELSVDEMKSIIAPSYKNWCEEEYKRYIDCFGLSGKQRIATLSKGMKMKLSLALALSHKAELLIMDEPTDGLDPVVRKQFLDILNDYIRQDGNAVFFSTHITSDLDKIADKLILINNGKIIFEKEKDRLLDEYRIVKGKVSLLNNENQELFMNLETSQYSFKGLAENTEKMRRTMKDVVFERPSIEDIMLNYIEGGIC